MHSVVSSKRDLPVVVGIDGSRSHPETVDLAADQAARLRAPLLIVHVWPGHYSGAFRIRGAIPTQDDGKHLLDLAARRAQLRIPDLDVSTELADGSAAQVLVERSEHARLLVVGHRDVILTRPSWGSTTAYLAHHGSCPLLVHRGVVPGRGPVVLAVSTRDGAAATIRYAFEEAAATGSRLVALHVWTYTGPGPAGGTPATGFAVARREADARLAEAMEGWDARFPDVDIERLLVHDVDIGYTLERASRRGRLLVAGMGRSGRFVELLYGSLGGTLLRQTACPVLLVPPGWTVPKAARAARRPAAARRH
ncbi:universal stress protein [Actinoplanes sp. NPDC049316]|uniref:universal stress protein n=1 Tax=Actinoplanes sp. NPDC049316 TaxID=3154727 RepID=UPI00342CEA4F